MCDPVTLALAAGAAGTALFANSKDSTPPPAALPAIGASPMAARTAGADVKVGDGAPAVTPTSTPTYQGFSATRTFGTPLGGLGRGGLGL